MTHKKKLYSLLAILLSVTLLVTGIISALILWLAQRSTSNFENFLIESRQQELSSAVQSFSSDVERLTLLMVNELSDSTLARLQLYYDSSIFNYSYLGQAQLVQKQINIIQNSMAFTESVEVYMSESKRGVNWFSIFPVSENDFAALRATLNGGTSGTSLKDGKLRLMFSKAPLDSAVPHNAIIVATIFPRALYAYLVKYLPDTSYARMVVFTTVDGMEAPFAMNSGLTTEACQGIGQAIHGQESGYLRYSLADGDYLLTFQKVPSAPLTLCQMTPMRLISEQMQEYRRMIVLVCAVSILVMLGLSLFLYHMVHKPVAKINDALVQVGRGELSVRLTDARSREFQAIYDQFNQMTVRLQELIDREYTLKLLNAKSELKQLRYQIRPHFLYNTYFNLRALLQNEEYDVAEQMMDVLGRYLRYITTSGRDEATLREELEHAAAYMEIQKMRFGAHLETRMEPYPESCAGKLVPRIIVQPLIENAFEHGIRDMKDTGIIAVSFACDAQQLSIFVDDNGPNVSDELLERTQAILDAEDYAPQSDSVALSNIHRRIRMLFEPGSGLYISHSPLGGFRSEIRMIGEKKYVADDDR